MAVKQPHQGDPPDHPVMMAEPEIVDAGEDSEYDVAIQTNREADEWIEWSGPICWILGEDGGSR